MNGIDVLVVGAGPSGLATAIQLKNRLNKEKIEKSVVVIDKAQSVGYHNLSGAVFEAVCLDKLLPDWRISKDPIITDMLSGEVKTDQMYFLTKNKAFKIPHSFVPKQMSHKRDYTISISKLIKWLASEAEKIGVEIYSGFAAKDVLFDNDYVKGIRLVDLGLGKENTKKSNFLKGETLEAKVTVLGDGSRGYLSGQLIKQNGEGKNPQVYSVGLKQIIKLPDGNSFGENRAIHTLGHPNKNDVFGGGFIYSMRNNHIALGLILGMDWKYQDLNPQQELEIFKSHPFIQGLIKDGQVIASGVKTIPEGGYNSLPVLTTNGAIIVGDAAGFVNMEKIKGIHYAVLSGIAAGDAIFNAMQKENYSKESLQKYEETLEEGIMKEMKHARNYRQVFKHGLLVGAPLSKIQSMFPYNVKMKDDYKTMKKGKKMKHDLIQKNSMDRATFVSLSGATHREDEPPHILILSPDLCIDCSTTYGSPCNNFCPGEVYRIGPGKAVISASNCMHDGSCQVKCPYQNILWTPPEGGEGPRYKQM